MSNLFGLTDDQKGQFQPFAMSRANRASMTGDG
jgi:hypothetical protein